jgi:predicted TIM-barrel fold metal-dependent hydrolase
VPNIVQAIGEDTSCIVMGSDFPHAEGLGERRDFVTMLDGLSDAAQRAVLRDNAEPIFV